MKIWLAFRRLTLRTMDHTSTASKRRTRTITATSTFASKTKLISTTEPTTVGLGMIENISGVSVV